MKAVLWNEFLIPTTKWTMWFDWKVKVCINKYMQGLLILNVCWLYYYYVCFLMFCVYALEVSFLSLLCANWKLCDLFKGMFASWLGFRLCRCCNCRVNRITSRDLRFEILVCIFSDPTSLLRFVKWILSKSLGKN